MEDIIHIKNAFLSLLIKKIVEVNNIFNKSKSVKPWIKMTTKRLLRKQIIVLMDKMNVSIIINNANAFISKIKNHLHNSNLNTSANFIWLENNKVIITTNQITSSQNINIIKKCIKESENINLENIDNLQLSKSKLYLKILGLLYLVENQLITSEIISEAI